MLGEILRCVVLECKAFMIDKGGTVILKTDYRAANLPTYTMPLIILDVLDASDTFQYPGGVTRADWNMVFNSYNYMPDPTGDDPSNYSTDLMNIIDDIRRHFSKGIWINTEGTTMYDLLNNYCFKYTLSGIVSAIAIEGDGLVMGYGVVFDSVGIDNDTDSTVEDYPLENIRQLDCDNNVILEVDNPDE